MPVQDRTSLVGPFERPGGVLPHGLEHPVAGPPAVMCHDHERPVHQAREQLQHLAFFDHPARADPFCRLQGEASREDRQAAEEYFISFREQGVAPVHGGPERPVAGQGYPAAPQEPETIVEPLEDLPRR